MSLEECNVHCPYCGEAISVVVDLSVPEQNYIEDCAVCCRPIEFSVSVDVSGAAAVSVKTDNE